MSRRRWPATVNPGRFIPIVDNGNGTATFTGTPAPETSGTYVVTVTADNSSQVPGFIPVTQSFTLTVYQAPAPSGLPTGSVDFTRGQALSSPINFTASGCPPRWSRSSACPKVSPVRIAAAR